MRDIPYKEPLRGKTKRFPLRKSAPLRSRRLSLRIRNFFLQLDLPPPQNFTLPCSQSAVPDSSPDYYVCSYSNDCGKSSIIIYCGQKQHSAHYTLDVIWGCGLNSLLLIAEFNLLLAGFNLKSCRSVQYVIQHVLFFFILHVFHKLCAVVGVRVRGTNPLEPRAVSAASCCCLCCLCCCNFRRINNSRTSQPDAAQLVQSASTAASDSVLRNLQHSSSAAVSAAV